MAVKKTKKKEEVTRQVLSIQVIHYVCTNCGEEIEEVKICNSCKAPMRVLEVKEYYGDEAHKKLEEIVGKPKSIIKTSTGENEIEQVNVLNALADDDDMDKLDGIEGLEGAGKKDNDEWKQLEALASDTIFSDDSDEEIEEAQKVEEKNQPKNNSDIAAMLDLDKEDEAVDPDLEEDFKSMSDDSGL